MTTTFNAAATKTVGVNATNFEIYIRQHQAYDATALDDYTFDFLTSHQYYRLSPTARRAICEAMKAPAHVEA